MRALLTPLILACAISCSPAPPASDSAPETKAPSDNSAALSATPASGAWVSRTDEGVTSTCFGAPNSECAISFVCEAPSGKLTLLASAELIPDQPTTLTLLTRTQTFQMPARSFNEGLPSINADLADASAEKAALLEALAPTQDVFAIDANGEITVYPWNETVAQTLNACR